MAVKTTVRSGPDRQVAEIASTQFGLITRQQLEACDFRRGAIARAVERGRLIRVDRGVYAVGRPPEEPMAAHLAALLSMPGAAWLRGLSAGEAWRILPRPSGCPVQVCVVDGGGRSRAGLDVRRLRHLDPGDRTRLGPLPVTGLARTVIDLGHELGPDDLERSFAEAVVVHRLRPSAVRFAVDRAPRGPGVAAVRRLLAYADGPRHTRTEIERRLLGLVRESGLPVPRMNVRVGRFVVDALWPDERVIGEADGFAAHGSRRSFEADRRRDAELQARGFVVTRMTWRQLTDDRLPTAARLGAILAVRRAGDGA